MLWILIVVIILGSVAVLSRCAQPWAAPFALIAALSLTPTTVQAQLRQLPAVLTRGLTLLQADSVHEAVSSWSKNWSNASDAGKAETLESAFNQLVGAVGKMRSYEVIGVDSLTPHLSRIYILLRYNIPVYAQFTIYDRGERVPDWLVATIRFHTDPEQVLPAGIWKR